MEEASTYVRRTCAIGAAHVVEPLEGIEHKQGQTPARAITKNTIIMAAMMTTNTTATTTATATP